MNRMLDAALEYAGRGGPALPIVERGKLPLTPHGLKDASTDSDVIAEWWQRWPSANVGVCTDGFVIVDCDGPVGKHNWLRFIAGIGFPESPYAWTGGGGLHIWYRRDDHPTRNRAGWLDHVDIRSQGGYVIVPPSVHPSGASYWWERSPNDCEVPSMPSRLVDALTRKLVVPVPPVSLPIARPAGCGYGQTALADELDKVRAADEGRRNDQLVRSSFNLGQLVGVGQLDANEVAGGLLSAAMSVGLPSREALATIESGLRAGVSTPRHR
jgi:hypothetical protein